MYTICPLCNQKASETTIKNHSECNDCQCKRRLGYYNDANYRLSKIKSEFAADLLMEFIIFLKKSSWKFVLLSRMVVDFIKILKGYDGKVQIKNSQLELDYYSKSSIKSPTIIFTIKAYLSSKNLLVFDGESNQASFYPEDIRPEKRFKENVCDYFFSEYRCHDCGKKLTDNTTHNYCYDCVAYRTIFRRTTIEYLNATYSNSSIKGLYINFIYYMYSINRTTQTYAEILSNVEKFFIYIQNYIPEGLKMYPFALKDETKEFKYKVINGSIYVSVILSEDWLTDFEKEFSESNNSKDIFLVFLESVGLLKLRIKDEKEKIIENIKQLNKSFQQPLLKMLEFENDKMENFSIKNASRTKKWVSVRKNIDEIRGFYYWLIEHYPISSWAEVEEDMVNKYLLEFDFMNGQIRKRSLFNFFTYMKKHGFVFTVPIEQFVARDSMIEVEPLSLNKHKAVLKAIEHGDEDLVTERFLSSLVYFHGFTSAQIKAIELENILLEEKCILVKDRPPAYLSNYDLRLLKNVLDIRYKLLGRKQSNKLFPAFKSLKDVSISNALICKKVKKATGYTPKRLRMSAFQYCAAEFGAQYLCDSFGLSLTQSARYARIGEEFLELQVLDEINSAE